MSLNSAALEDRPVVYAQQGYACHDLVGSKLQITHDHFLAEELCACMPGWRGFSTFGGQWENFLSFLASLLGPYGKARVFSGWRTKAQTAAFAQRTRSAIATMRPRARPARQKARVPEAQLVTKLASAWMG